MATIRFESAGLDKTSIMQWIQEEELDGILLTSPENVFYTTGYPCLPGSGNPIIYGLRNQVPFYVFIDRRGMVTLLCWMGATWGGVEYGVDEVRTFFTFEMSQMILSKFFKEKLPELHRIGIESTCPYYVLQLINELTSDVSYTVVDQLINALRLVKSEEEIARIRTSTNIVDQTVTELFDILHVGMSRLDLLQEAKARTLKNGGHAVDHVTIAFGTANPEVAIGELLEKDQIVTLDLGAVYEGYVSDNRKLAYSGPLPRDLIELHAKLCGIVEEVGQALRPGKTFAEMHQLAKSCYAKEELSPTFLHAGHSMGIQVDEAWLLGNNQTPIQEGMVLNIELYSRYPPGVMIGNEETYVVREHGPECLTTLPPQVVSIV